MCGAHLALGRHAEAAPPLTLTPPLKGFPLQRFEQASPKRKRYEASNPTTKGFPSDDGSPGGHSGIVHIEQNSLRSKKSEIVGDTTHIKTERSDIDEDGAAKRQKPKNNRGLKATLLAPKRGRSVERDRKERERGVEESFRSLFPKKLSLLEA